MPKHIKIYYIMACMISSHIIDIKSKFLCSSKWILSTNTKEHNMASAAIHGNMPVHIPQ